MAFRKIPCPYKHESALFLFFKEHLCLSFYPFCDGHVKQDLSLELDYYLSSMDNWGENNTEVVIVANSLLLPDS